MRKIILSFLLNLLFFGAYSQTDSVTWLKVSATQLLKADSIKDTYIQIASRKNELLEEAPSIVSVITRKDIEIYGARDLADLLRMVPGFDLAVDIDGIYGMGFRGIWAHEGKVLLMVNGVGTTELSYGNLNLIGTFPTSMMERIEIIRGPGSVLYGGFAEVTVINIITHKAANLRGLELSANTGIIGKNAITGNTNLSAGLKTDIAEIAIHAGIGTNPQSTRTYEAFAGADSISELSNQNAFRDSKHLIVDATIKNIKFNYNINSLIYSAQNSYINRQKVNGLFVEKAYNIVQSTHISYESKISKSITLIPLLEYTYSKVIGTPLYSTLSTTGIHYNEDTFMDKWRAEINTTFRNNLMLGIGYMTDNIHSLTTTGLMGLKLSNNLADTVKSNTVYSYYAYGQYGFKLKGIKFTLGARYEHTFFGDAFLPRLSAIYYKNKFNAKLLFSKSFRAPTLFQAYTRAFGDGDRVSLIPEIASTLELEVGYKFNNAISLKTNLFYINIDNPLVYLIESYINYGKIASAGIESELNINHKNYGGFINFALALPQEGTYNNFLSADRSSFLGFATIKINAGTYYKIGKLTIAPKIAYLSARHGQTKNFAQGDTNNEFESQVYNANFLLDCNISYKNLFKNFDIHLTTYNLLNDYYKLLQPYYGTHAPMPVYDRQVIIGAVWKY